MDGEEAYKKLTKAKNQDRFNQQYLGINTEAKKLKLDPAKHESYIREIMEKGGAPNLSELYRAAQAADEKTRAGVLIQTVNRLFGGE